MKIDKFGWKYGCHTCGDRMQTHYIADHMPPLKLVKALRGLWGESIWENDKKSGREVM